MYLAHGQQSDRHVFVKCNLLPGVENGDHSVQLCPDEVEILGDGVQLGLPILSSGTTQASIGACHTQYCCGQDS